MICLTSVGRSAKPIQCNNGFLSINERLVRCPSWQRKGYSIPTSRILEFHKQLPAKGITLCYDKLKEDFQYVGAYNFVCVDWEERVDSTTYYVLFNSFSDYYDLQEVINCYNSGGNPLTDIEPHK